MSSRTAVRLHDNVDAGHLEATTGPSWSSPMDLVVFSELSCYRVLRIPLLARLEYDIDVATLRSIRNELQSD
jgi:hypothetical protein